jgi:hypothetical protein
MPLVPADWMQYRMPIVKYILWQAVQQVCAWHKYTHTHTHTYPLSSSRFGACLGCYYPSLQRCDVRLVFWLASPRLPKCHATNVSASLCDSRCVQYFPSPCICFYSNGWCSVCGGCHWLTLCVASILTASIVPRHTVVLEFYRQAAL